jgi:uncharacterized protein (TIGR02996 family)
VDEEQALLAAVRANPNDSTLRLAFADWLLEHDQVERSEWIRDLEIFWWMGPDYVSPMPAILEWLKLTDPIERDKAGPVIRRLGNAVVEPLRGAFNSGGEQLRQGIAEIFSWIRDGTPLPVPQLIVSVRSPDLPTTRLAVIELGWHGPAAAPALPALIEAWDRIDEEATDELSVRGFGCTLARTFGQIGPAAIAAAPLLTEALASSYSLAAIAQDALVAIGPCVVGVVCREVGRLGSAQQRGISIIAKVATDPIPYYHQLLRDPDISRESQRLVMEELVKANAVTSGTTAELEQLLQAQDGWVRFHAARAVFDLGPGALEALSVISDLVGNHDTALDNAAREWLQKHGFPLR